MMKIRILAVLLLALPTLATAATVHGSYGVSTTGYVSASTFYGGTYYGDGSGLTNLPASSADSITSGTTKVTANSTGYISLTTGGVTTGYFNTTGGLVVPAIGVGRTPARPLDVSTSTPFAVGVTSSGYETGISLKNTSSNGRDYWIISGGSGGSYSGGGFGIYDATASTNRAYISAGVNGWQTPSDRRLKTNIQTLSVLAKIDGLRGVSYNLKESGKPQIGVIAQEVQKAFPTAVTGKESAKTYLGVSYDAIAAIALQGVKELKALVDTNTADIATLKAENDTLKAQLKAVNDNYARITKEVEALKATRN